MFGKGTLLTCLYCLCICVLTPLIVVDFLLFLPPVFATCPPPLLQRPHNINHLHQFARTLSLGASLGHTLEKPAKRYFTPVLKEALDPEYHK